MMLQDPNSTPTPNADDIEPWIIFLVERLSRPWPWLLEATPRQISLLSGALAAIFSRIIVRNSLHVEIEHDPAATEAEVDVIVQTMKPERVQ